MSWITKSNRLKHLIFAIPCAFLLTFLFVLGLGVGMEFKDKMWGGKWDWLDLTATCIGGVIGQILQIVLIWLIFKNPY